MTIPLINKQDTFEVVRDQLVTLLRLEFGHQFQLATTSGQVNPNLWNVHVFGERLAPWESATNLPIVTVGWQNSMFSDQGAGNVVKRQKAQATYHIDAYGFGVSSGTRSGDEHAFLEAHRVIKLVRNILMHADNTYLGLRGLVWRRWVESMMVFIPQPSDIVTKPTVGVRLVLQVIFNELTVETPAPTLDTIQIDIRTEDGIHVY